METVTELVASHLGNGPFVALPVYKEFEWIFIGATKAKRSQKGLELPLENEKFGTSLLWALCELRMGRCREEALQLFKLVLSLNPSLSLKNNDGLNAKQLCQKFAKPLLLEILNNSLIRRRDDRKAAIKEKEIVEKLKVIAESGDEKAISKFIAKNPTFNLFPKARRQPLNIIHYVAKTGNVKAMDLLFTYIQNWNMKGRKPLYKREVVNRRARGLNLMTPLMIASRFSRLEMVMFLVNEKDCDLVAKDEMGITAVHHATLVGSVEIFQVLMDAMDEKYGREIFERAINAWNIKDGEDMLLSVARLGHSQIIKLLLEYRYVRYPEVDKGWTAMHAAAFEGHLRVVKELLETKKGSRKQKIAYLCAPARSLGKPTALEIAQGNGHTHVAEVS